MSLKNNLFSLLFLASFLFNGLNAAVEINSSNLFIPTSLDGVRLFHDENGFTVVKDGDEFPVKTECLDKELINLSDEDLDFVLGLKAKIEIDDEAQIFTRISPKFVPELINESQELIKLNPEDSEKIISQLPASSYIQVFQFNDGEYGLHLKTRLPGGGPLLGKIVWWGTRTILYGIAAAAAGTVIVATGGVAGLAGGAAMAGVVSGATAATTVVGGAIAGAGLAGAAATATTVVVAGAGSVGASVLWVESAAAAAGAIATLAPTV